ncbi:MAG: hypothetical protein WBP12_01800 [Candidatus Saccharimonas sp.]
MKRVLLWLFPDEFMRNPAYFRGIALAGLYVALLLSQLFTFEKFAEVTLGFGFPGGLATAWIVAVIIPLIELAALPYLISMRLPAWVRNVSYWCVLAVPVLWLVILLWQLLSSSASQLNAGIFGATLTTALGPWLIVFGVIMFWAAVLVARELPRRRD